MPLNFTLSADYHIALDTHPATPIEFVPLAHLPQRTPHRMHGTGQPANSPELELAQAHPERDGLRRETNANRCSKGIHMTSNPSPVSLCRIGKLIPASGFFSQLGVFFDKSHEISSGVFSGKIRGRYIFTSNKYKALQTECQLIHFEGAFHGAF